MLHSRITYTYYLQTWGQILLKVFKCKYFSIFQMQILLFSSNANTFQKYFKYFFKYFFKYLEFYILAYINILNVKIVMQINTMGMSYK